MDYLHNGSSNETQRTYEWRVGEDVDEAYVKKILHLLDGNNLYLFTIKDKGELKSQVLKKEEWLVKKKIMESLLKGKNKLKV